MRAAILYSTYSGGGKGTKSALAMAKEMTTAKLEFGIFENQWPDDLSNYTHAIVSGGDGTVNYYFNKYKENALPVVFLPAGSGNDFFWALYGKVSVVNQIKATVNYLSQSGTTNYKLIDIGQCLVDHQKTIYFDNSIGLGFDGEVLKDMKIIRKIGGHLGYMLVVVKNIFTYKEPEFEIKIAGINTTNNATILNIANAPRTGGGFMISPQASLTDNQLNVLYCHVPTIIKRLRALLKVEKGKHITLRDVEYFPSTHIEVTANKLILGQADGEQISGQHFIIQLAPWKGKIININPTFISK